MYARLMHVEIGLNCVCLLSLLNTKLCITITANQTSTNVSKILTAVNITAQILMVVTTAHAEADTHLQLIFTTA